MARAIQEAMAMLAIGVVLYGVLAFLFGTGNTEIAGAMRLGDADSGYVGEREIRLFGIDAPEADQQCRLKDGSPWECGRWAAAEARKTWNGRNAACVVLDQDQYGRAVVRCRVGGEDVAAELVRAGLATAYTRYSNDYTGIEKEAVVAGRGIFSAELQSPEVFRANR